MNTTASPSPTQTHSFRQRLALAVIVPLGSWALRALAASWRVRLIASAQSQPQNSSQPLVYGVWHDGLLTIVGQWRDHAIQGLASQSFDGEIISRIMQRLGYPALARGSSSRGGGYGVQMQLAALREGRHVVVAMDGPRGPRHDCKAGTVLMAARSGCRLVPLLCASQQGLRLRNWDRTLIPWPFAKVAFVMGEPIAVPEQAAGYKQVLADLPSLMDRLEAQAEAALNDF